MAAALPFLALAGSAVSAVGAIKSGADQQAAMGYNAQLQKVQGQTAVDQSIVQAQQQDIANRRRIGDMTAAAGASGVDMTGSPLAVMADQAMQGETAKQLILYRGRLQLNQADEQAAIDTASGGMAASKGIAQAGSTLLTGATTFGKDYLTVGVTK